MSAVIGGLCVLVVLLCGALLLSDAERTMDSGMKKTGDVKKDRN